MADYVVESRLMNGEYLATLPFRDLQFETMLSKSGGARFTMPLNAVQKLTLTELEEGRTEIHIARNGVKIYAGPLWDLDISSSDNTVKATSESLESYMELRQVEVDTEYNGVYGTAAWNLINQTQTTNGTFYITRGTAVGAGGPAGLVKIDAAEIIYDQLENISDGALGFDWVITPDRVYNQYYPRINTRAKVVLEYPGSIVRYGLQRQGKYLRNKVRTIGPNGVLTDYVTDSTSISKYGVRHYAESKTDLKTTTLLNNNSALVLAQRKLPKLVPTVSVKSTLINPFENDITLGQITRVIINDGYVQYNEDMRLVGFQTTVGKQGQESFIFYMNDLREGS
mgnify:CR=1 FL=1